MKIYHYKILIKNLLPEDSTVNIKKTNKDKYYFRITSNISEKEFDDVKDKTREIIGTNLISEFYTETTGKLWYVYLK